MRLGLGVGRGLLGREHGVHEKRPVRRLGEHAEMADVVRMVDDDRSWGRSSEPGWRARCGLHARRLARSRISRVVCRRDQVARCRPSGSLTSTESAKYTPSVRRAGGSLDRPRGRHRRSASVGGAPRDVLAVEAMAGRCRSPTDRGRERGDRRRCPTSVDIGAVGRGIEHDEDQTVPHGRGQSRRRRRWRCRARGSLDARGCPRASRRAGRSSRDRGRRVLLGQHLVLLRRRSRAPRWRQTLRKARIALSRWRVSSTGTPQISRAATLPGSASWSAWPRQSGRRRNSRARSALEALRDRCRSPGSSARHDRPCRRRLPRRSSSPSRLFEQLLPRRCSDGHRHVGVSISSEVRYRVRGPRSGRDGLQAEGDDGSTRVRGVGISPSAAALRARAGRPGLR